MTQLEYILEQLKKFRKITRLDIFKEGYGMTLNSRIPDIKNMGYAVEKEMIWVRNGMGKKVQVARYWIEQPEQGVLI